MPAAARPRVVSIGVGGATSSGKTTLSKHLLDLLGPSLRQAGGSSAPAQAQDKHGKLVLVHQDDFVPEEKDLPWNDAVQAVDWDTPYGSVKYPDLARAISYAKAHGSVPPGVESIDHLNELPGVPVSSAFRDRWQARFAALLQDKKDVSIVIAEGFLLYFSPLVRHELDVRLFIRTPRDEILRRRESRGGYNTAEGTHWVDPPGYFDKCVWPAYEVAHKKMFAQGDVEHGAVLRTEGPGDGGPVGDVVLIEDRSVSVDDTQEIERQVNVACETVEKALQALGL